MKKEGKKFFIPLLMAFLLLLGIIGGYAWFLKREKPQGNKPVAVCGKLK
jgi:hypothetical protein